MWFRVARKKEYFESSPTYVVKKTQLWGVQSFLFPLLWLFAPDAVLNTVDLDIPFNNIKEILSQDTASVGKCLSAIF